MRLDEWKQFIESQFLDDDAPLTPPTETSKKSAVDPQKTLFAETLEVVEVSPFVVKETQQPLGTPVSTPEKTPYREAPSVTNARYSLPGLQRDTTPPITAKEKPSTPFPELDIQIPTFDKYLPKKTVEPELTLPLTPPAETKAEPVSPPPPQAKSESPRLVEPKATSTGTPPITRRTPRSRAPHARNVRPDYVPSGLSAAELWAGVPRHVQTLLSMQRQGEETEVAQFSYKKPFAETRQELIERLVDPILSLEETARLLNVCPTTVRRYTNKGILTHYRKNQESVSRNDSNSEKETRQRRFRLSDILTFLETQQSAIEASKPKDGSTSQDYNEVESNREP